MASKLKDKEVQEGNQTRNLVPREHRRKATLFITRALFIFTYDKENENKQQTIDKI